MPVAKLILACKLVFSLALLLVLNLQHHAQHLMARLILPQAQLAQLQGVTQGGPVEITHPKTQTKAPDINERLHKLFRSQPKGED